jgi:hypothetical protein
VTDESPFYYHFLPFDRLLSLWRTGGRLALPYLEWGLVAQALVLVQAIPIAAFLILMPLLFLPRPGHRASPPSSPPGARGAKASVRWEPSRAGRGDPSGARGRASLFLYFALLGLGFMVLEVSSIQRLILFLAEPVYATSVVLAAFLVFAGLGSLMAQRLTTAWDPTRLGRLSTSWLPFLAIALLGPLTDLGGRALWEFFAAGPLAARMALALGLLAPLAFCMGMPFPLGLQQVADTRRDWIPWCWGVNGFLSVIGAAAAPLFALAIGFRGVSLLAGGFYLLAGLTLSRGLFVAPQSGR